MNRIQSLSFLLLLFTPPAAAQETPTFIPDPERLALDTEYGEVTFRCNETEAVTLATIEFYQEAGDPAAYPIFVYATGNLRPVIRYDAETDDVDFCNVSATSAVGDQATLPSGEIITIGEGETERASKFIVNAPDTNLGAVTITLGTLTEGEPPQGEYLAYMGGFTVEPTEDTDTIRVRNGPRLSDMPLDLYVIGVGENSRLDPFLSLDEDLTCDDAGRRACAEMAAFTNAGLRLSDGTTWIGDRFDAGVRLPADDVAVHTLTVGSFNGNTGGDYGVFLIGGFASEL